MAAGIVLETEVSHQFIWNSDVWELELTKKGFPGQIPAPSMSEVWRELSEARIFKEKDGMSVAHLGPGSSPMFNINPTDALIDLLIWARKERP
jgi:hypothetical protein